MSTVFDRNRAQLRCESIFSCTTPEDWKLVDFKNLQLSKANASLLHGDLREDSKDLYFKGILSLFDAIHSFDLGLYSWATVKIYYSIFYLLKCTLAANGIAIIRQKSLFYLIANEGESPITKGNKKYNSDHSGTINYFIDLFTSDLLLSQQIDSTNSYDWMMNRREQINYRERQFNEPNHSFFWNYLVAEKRNGKMEKLIRDYIVDSFVLCFQEEHAVLAIPIKRIILTRKKMDDENINPSLSVAQKKMLENLIPYNVPELLELIK